MLTAINKMCCDNASGKHIPFGCAGVVAGVFVPSCSAFVYPSIL